MNRKRATFTRNEIVGVVIFLAIVTALTHLGFFYIKGRQATASVDSELSTTLAPQLSKHGVTSFKVTSAGLQIVESGRTMCLLRGGLDQRDGYRVVSLAEKAGCGQDSKVMLLDQVQASMPRGYGLSFVFLKDDEVVRADRLADGNWTSTVDLKWPSAGTGQRVAVNVIEDIEGMFAVLKIAPSEARSPAELQHYLTR